METIIIERTAYKVSKKEFSKIKKLEDKLTEPRAVVDHKAYCEADANLRNYLNENKHNYKCIGEIMFHYSS